MCCLSECFTHLIKFDSIYLQLMLITNLVPDDAHIGALYDLAAVRAFISNLLVSVEALGMAFLLAKAFPVYEK